MEFSPFGKWGAEGDSRDLNYRFYINEN